MKTNISELKDQARRLRAELASSGRAVAHGEALELVAKSHGHRDWNTAHAAAGNRPADPPVALGDTVSGRYLGQPFLAEAIGVEARSAGRWRITLQLAEPVDVVRFESFSAFRSRVTATIDADGRTVEKTSDGKPHLTLDLRR